MGGGASKRMEDEWLTVSELRSRPTSELEALRAEMVQRFLDLERENDELRRQPASPKHVQQLPDGLEFSNISDDPALVGLEPTNAEYLTILHDVVDRRLEKPGIVKECDRAIDVGDSDFSDIYNIIWARIQRRQDDLQEYLQVAATLTHLTGADDKQSTDDVRELYDQAASVKDAFDSFVNSIQDQARGTVGARQPSFENDDDELISPSIEFLRPTESRRGFTASARSFDSDSTSEEDDDEKKPCPFEVVVPRDLKKLGRICEKAALRPDKPGSADRIFDVCRCMIVVHTMHDAALVLRLLASRELVRVKERFVDAPTPGGWRDCLVNFRLSGHIVEVQIVHRELLVARKGLPGHAIYNVVRNAREILERIGVGDRVRRPQRIRELKKTVSYFRRIGVSLTDLVAANCFTASEFREGRYSAEDLRTAGLPLEEILHAGFTAAELRNADARDPGALLHAGYPVFDVFAAFEISTQQQIEACVLRHLCHAFHHNPAMPTKLLRSLQLKNCQLQGQIPPTLGLCKNLEILDLSQNPELTGCLPRELAQLHKLHFLDLSATAVVFPGSHVTIGAAGFDPKRDSRQRVEQLLPYLYHVDLGFVHFETRLSLGILWCGLTVAAVVGQAKALGVSSNWVAFALNDDIDLSSDTVKQESRFKALLAKKTRKNGSCLRIRFAGPAPWTFEKNNDFYPFDPVLAVELESAYAAKRKFLRVNRGSEHYEFDLVQLTQTRLIHACECDHSNCSATINLPELDDDDVMVRGTIRTIRRLTPVLQPPSSRRSLTAGPSSSCLTHRTST